jgi:hypothetical protein
MVVVGILHLGTRTHRLIVEVAVSVVPPLTALAYVEDILELGREMLSGTGNFVVVETLYTTAVVALVDFLRDIVVVGASSPVAEEGLEDMPHLGSQLEPMPLLRKDLQSAQS